MKSYIKVESSGEIKGKRKVMVRSNGEKWEIDR